VTGSVRATVIIVAFRTPTLDADWIPDAAQLLIVHNDSTLPPSAVTHPAAQHLHTGRNLGFGAAVNLALQSATGDRIVLCNPDASLDVEHWPKLVDASPHEVVSISLVEEDGRRNANANPYPTPAALVATSFRLGRLLGLRDVSRSPIARLLGRWGSQWQQALSVDEGRWPLRERWLTGAVLSVDAARMRSVGGFDDQYFLYLEDVDLQRRLALAFPSMEAVIPGGKPGLHRSGSSSDGDRRPADIAYAESAVR
jgi:N-acetylglucosaminyl-diphospho-decaprenol L-rhamnosyltransferase